MQAYSDPSRESEEHALPDIEVFYEGRGESMAPSYFEDGTPMLPGWYYWYCFPGCLPDSDPVGPFESAREAEAAAQEDAAG